MSVSSKKKKARRDEDYEDASDGTESPHDTDASDDDFVQEMTMKTKVSGGVKKQDKVQEVRKAKLKTNGKAKAKVEETKTESKPKFKYTSFFTPSSRIHSHGADFHSWAAAKAAKIAGPIAPGSKAIPEPKDSDVSFWTCLRRGSSGELDSFVS